MDPTRRAVALGEMVVKRFNKAPVVKPLRKGTFPHEKIVQRLVGRVASTKMQKTISVSVDSFRWHRKVQKLVRTTNKVMAHDEGFVFFRS